MVPDEGDRRHLGALDQLRHGQRIGCEDEASQVLKPYYQAHDRGVKLIGATAHYVTADLDEGPIIEQDVARADHAMDPATLTALGRDVECVVLSRAVKWHAERRVLVNGHKTVVFR